MVMNSAALGCLYGWHRTPFVALRTWMSDTSEIALPSGGTAKILLISSGRVLAAVPVHLKWAAFGSGAYGGGSASDGRFQCDTA